LHRGADTPNTIVKWSSASRHLRAVPVAEGQNLLLVGGDLEPEIDQVPVVRCVFMSGLDDLPVGP
jgi:hypothetical protein